MTADTDSQPAWVVLIYRLPAEPTRHRVAVWRELRKAGALALQQATWALPASPEFEEALTRAVGLVQRGGGEALVLDVVERDETVTTRLEALFTEAREAEWQEFLSDCDKFEAEVGREIRAEKFTAAELEEEEQSLDRLRRWFRDLRTKDLFVAPSQETAERRLKGCAEALEEFTELVYQKGEP